MDDAPSTIQDSSGHQRQQNYLMMGLDGQGGVFKRARERERKREKERLQGLLRAYG